MTVYKLDKKDAEIQRLKGELLKKAETIVELEDRIDHILNSLNEITRPVPARLPVRQYQSSQG